MSNKILVVSTNREKYPCPVIPAGAIQLTKELNEEGEEADFIDLCFEDHHYEFFMSKIREFKPGIIVFSVRNIDNETYLNPQFYLEEVLQYVNFCNSIGNIRTIIGGIGFIINYEGILNYLPVNYGIIDRSLHSIITLIHKLTHKESIEEVNNLVYKRNGRIVRQIKTEVKRKRDLLDWEYILKKCSSFYLIKKTQKSGPASIGVQTKTGCYYQCIHCQISQLEGRQIKPYPDDYIIGTLKIFKRHGIGECFFTDNVFNYPYNHAYTLCNKIIQAGLAIKWSCYLNPKFVDEKLIRAMKQAGCSNVQFGVDTADDTLLSLWKKGFTSVDIINAGRICEQERLNCSFSLIVGGIGETKDTLAESLQVLKKAKAKFIWGALGVRVQAGTSLYRMLVKENKLEPDKELLKPEFYISPGIQDYYRQVVEEFKKENPDILVKINEG